jgi:hypothetical protein
MEKDIQKEILDYLNLYGIAVKTGNGCFNVGNRFVKITSGFNGGKGWPDIVFIYKGIHLIECKTDKGKLSKDQEIMKKAIEFQGVKYNVCRCLGDAIMLKTIIDTESLR